MIEPIDFQEPNVVAYAIHREMTTEDVEHIHDDLRNAISEYDAVHLYVDVTELDEMEPRAVIEDLKMTPEYMSDIQRFAIVGDEGWQEWLTRAGDVLSKGEARYFKPDEAAMARQWLTQSAAGRRPAGR